MHEFDRRQRAFRSDRLLDEAVGCELLSVNHQPVDTMGRLTTRWLTGSRAFLVTWLYCRLTYAVCVELRFRRLWLLKTLSGGDPSARDVSGANDICLKRRTHEHYPCRRSTPRAVRASLEVSVRADQVLRSHNRPAPSGDDPSWLAAIGHTKDSLWSVDLFRCESILLKSYWVMAVMDVY